MNEKLTIQDLVDLLAEKHGMSKKDADNFVKEFFLLIEESLEKDKYVKIRGLGTFKLIDVDSRESVNVNTGERIEIQGHTKISFTPEPTLKDLVNKPFSHFETVVLNDNTVLEDTPLDTESEDEEQEQQRTEVYIKSDVSNEEVITIDKSDVVVTEEEKVVEEAPVIVQEPVIEKIAIETPVDKTEAEDIPKFESPEIEKAEAVDSSTMKYFIGIVVFVVVLCGGAIVFMYYPDMLDNLTSKPLLAKEEVAMADTVAHKTALTDSMIISTPVEPVKVDTVTESLKPKEAPKESVTQPVVAKEQKKPATPLEPDSLGYTIVGTETTYTIKEGETLTKVALRFYGTKALWPYIVKYNPDVIKNPDNVPFGTTIKIPKLAKKQ